MTDSCAGTPLNSTKATLTVTAANVPPTIVTQPIGTGRDGGSTTASFTVVATGSGTLTLSVVSDSGGPDGRKRGCGRDVGDVHAARDRDD